jgi:pimeloyl-ACP methyl ester carboxylesterase
MDRHVLDAVEVLDRYDIGTAHVLGWCTGAKLALRMSLQYCNRVASLTMLSGGFNIGQEELRTACERSASDILTDISASEDIAELYYDLIYNGNQHNSEADATARSVLQATNANYVQYTSLPFSSPESIYRYAQLLTTFLEDREIGDLGSIEVPTLTITAKTDPSTHPGASRYVAERIPGARHLELEDGDHYLMDSHADVVFGQVHKHIQTAMRSDALVGT